jgi:hypothetical protein
VNLLARQLVAGLLFVGASAPVSAQFSIDIDQTEMRRLTNRPAVMDLSVGEAGLLDRQYLCKFEGHLYVYARAELATEKGRFGYNYQLKHLPGGSFAVEVSAGSDATSTIDDYLEDFFDDPTPCIYFSTERSDLLPVATVNGEESLSALWENVLN